MTATMTKKQRLELTWIGKENRPRLEPRVLLEDPAKSYHAKQHVTDNDLFAMHALRTSRGHALTGGWIVSRCTSSGSV
jgi:hypothetical protein